MVMNGLCILGKGPCIPKESSRKTPMYTGEIMYIPVVYTIKMCIAIHKKRPYIIYKRKIMCIFEKLWCILENSCAYQKCV